MSLVFSDSANSGGSYAYLKLTPIYKYIPVEVVAEDQDCSPTFGEVCSYSITAPDQPFSVSPGGVIRNRVPLSASESRSHVLSVVAVDCGGKESSPVLVTITVTPSCSTAWSGQNSSPTFHNFPPLSTGPPHHPSTPPNSPDLTKVIM